MGKFVRSTNQVDAFRGDPNCGSDHGEADYQRRDRISFAMAVGVILVRRLNRQSQPVIDYRRTDHIQKRLDSIGQQGKRMPDEPSHAFDQRQTEVDDDAKQGGAQSAFHHLFGCGRARHSRIVSYSRRPRRVTHPKVFFFLNPPCPMPMILTKLVLE